MNLKRLFLLFFLLLLLPASALAQSYSFEVPEAIIDVWWNPDGTVSLAYEWLFKNDSGAPAIDYIDVGLPSSSYDLNSISADVGGVEITDIQNSPYVKPGVALGLGGNAIPAGQQGRVRAYIPAVRKDLYPDDELDGYASAVFSPTWFDSQFAGGTTDMTVVFHLPSGVQTEEPRWHRAPAGFSEEPEAALDDENRIVYIWRNPQARISKQYDFGASFPSQYVAEGVVVQPGGTGFDAPEGGEIGAVGAVGGLISCIGGLLSSLPFLVCFGVFAWIIVASARGTAKRKLQYLPPKVAIEGNGIKRGLTAVEAAILLEQPMDKILTMVLFSVIKKGAASVKTRDPLELEVTVPQPEGLNPYEVDFLQAFVLKGKAERRKKLQDAMVELVKSVAEKMKGFSRKETVAYYQGIIARAWQQVEAAQTPEVKSEKYDEVMDWTMLDKDYEDRTRRTFSGGPVFVPIWWHHYDPTFSRPTGPVSTGPAAIPSTGGGKSSLPHLPGSDFAASVVNGVQSFSAGVVGKVEDFTSGVTNRTNPVPKVSTTSSWRGSGSGGGGTHCVCACACACAGCACACAGGGR